MNKAAYKKHMRAYRTQLTAIKKELVGCNTENFIAVGSKIKGLSLQFDIERYKSFGVDRYDNFAWVIYRSMDKLGMTGAQALELVYRFRYWYV
jgi:phage replication-related protein YjqB (UPF0714/DUF867 family)